MNLLSQLPLEIVEEETTDLKQKELEQCHIDFDWPIKNELINLVLEINNIDIELVEDDYAISVLKDDSVYAFTPRRFAHAERVQNREIIDDLLRREIIQPSVSSYCTRIIPVRKRNGAIRLYVDLRPLNERVLKQKYPFPIIEDCLSRLANKSVFTLLDLKDGFQIKVHADSTKYFSFATLDGQYEYKRLPFGFSEAPAEFQKRLVQILNPLIRQDKVIVYMDDVLIPSESVEQNLLVLKEVLTTQEIQF